jgi:ssDNA-binding Zn-finger/Zn-ribbon topoisomerase 1
MTDMSRNITLNDFLKAFDKCSLDNLVERRMVYKALYDYFMIIIKNIGSQFLGLDENTLQSYQLKSRWEMAKIHLAIIENPNQWDILISELQNIRSKVEHKDLHDPDPDRLNHIREKAPEFKKWIEKVGIEYYKKSKDFTFKDFFYRMIKSYCLEAEWLYDKYGGATPFVAKSGYPTVSGKEAYKELKNAADALKKKLENLSAEEKLEWQDLDDLINIIKTVAEIKAKEEMLIINSTCPKCGGKIIEKENYYGDAETSMGLKYEIGCDSCDYVMHSESFDF